MVFKLKEIKKFLQGLVSTVSGLINAEITIVDDEFIVLAGTRKYQDKIGTKSVPHIYNCLFNKKEILIIENPREHSVCANCENKENCSEYAGINFPLIFDDEIVGGISISALDDLQKTRLLKNKDKYIDFSIKMVDLIQSKVNSYILTKKFQYTSKQLNSVINYANQGVILIDSSYKIKIINNYCCQIFDLEEKRILNENFNTIFKNEFLEDRVFNGDEFKNMENMIDVFNHSYRIIHSGKPIMIEENIEGYLWFLNDGQSMNKLVNKFITSKEDIEFDDIIGESKLFQKIKYRACSVADSNSTVLIQGESGTGKELLARAIHNRKFSNDKPFISINCGAIPENLIESELFGYEGGAFSGAKQKGKPGKFELADSGTLFLDEIGDMSLHLQGKLLRVLEEKKVTRLGGVDEIDVNVRIISATNKFLKNKVEKKEFRGDLYYRLNVIPLEIPSLRERGSEDIEKLTHFFIDKYTRILNKKIKKITDQALEILLKYSWPGNVRELENMIEYAINIDGDNILTAEDFPDRLQQDRTLNNNYIIPVEELKKRQVEKAIDYYGNTVEGKRNAASALGVGIATLYRWIKDYKLSI